MTPQEVQERVKHFDKWAKDWREEARESYAFVAGDQWKEEDVQILRDQRRPVVTFNRIAPMVAAATGVELMNRQEATYLPREVSDTATAEAYNAANRFCRDQGDFDDEESEAFFDVVVCGMGWTENRVDFDEDPEGVIVKDRIDPLEMGWDWRAQKPNLFDGEFRFRRKKYTLEQLEDRWPGSAGKVSATDASEAEAVEPHRSNPHDAYEGDEPQGQPHDKALAYEVIQFQYSKRVPVYVVADPETNQPVEFDAERFGVLQSRMKMLGMPIEYAMRRQKQYFQIYTCGAVELEPAEELEDGFTLNAITGTRDRNKNYWYGLVRVMKDPQRWANKFLSVIQHTMSTSGRGIMAEQDAFQNPRKAEEDWAKPDAIVWTRPGAIANKKITDKPSGIMPPGIDHLLTFAVSSIRDTSGLNLEMMGLADRQQAGILEQERKQAGITILAPLLNSLRRYRKANGRLMLNMIHRYFPPQRMVRIMGDGGPQVVRYMRAEKTPAFDIAVDDMPSAPNQKQQVWQSVMQMLPLLMKQPLPGEVWLAILEYSPLPNSLVQKVGKTLMAPNPQAEEARKLEFEEKKADIAETRSKEVLNYANALEEGARGMQEILGKQMDEASASRAMERDQMAFAADEERKAAAFGADQARTEQKAALDMILKAAQAAQQQERQNARQ